MARDRAGIQHITDGTNVYSLIVLPEGDHWMWVVTHADTSRGQTAGFSRRLSPPRHAATIADAWKAAEEFVERCRDRPYPPIIERELER